MTAPFKRSNERKIREKLGTYSIVRFLEILGFLDLQSWRLKRTRNSLIFLLLSDFEKNITWTVLILSLSLWMNFWISRLKVTDDIFSNIENLRAQFRIRWQINRFRWNSKEIGECWYSKFWMPERSPNYDVFWLVKPMLTN